MTDLEIQAFNLRDEGRIYFDHNAGAPIAAELVPQINKWLTAWGNPSSIHFSGRGPKSLIRESRARVAYLVGALPSEIVFTSGGSEANNMAILGGFSQIKKQTGRNTIITTEVEHPSVRESIKHLEQLGARVVRLKVSRNGELSLAELEKMLNQDVALVSIMTANNETGTIFPVKKIPEMVHAVGAYFHTDAVQALGKISIDLKKWDVDLASFAGHKFYALKGTGFLYIKKGTPISPLMHGGAQERHRRPGTENVLGIASLGYMAQYKTRVSEEFVRISALRDQMEDLILDSVKNVEITGRDVLRLPNTSSLVISGVDGESLLMNLDIAGVSVSTGAACSSGAPEPSPVLMAMGLTRKEAQSSLRLSLGWGSSESEVRKFVDILSVIVERLRRAHEIKPIEAQA